MKKSCLSLLSLFLILFSFSCSFDLLEKTDSGKLAFTLPGVQCSRAASTPDAELPKEYKIKITSVKGNFKKEGTYPAGSTILIEQLPIGNVEVIIEGTGLYYGYYGKTNVTIVAKETTPANVTLNRFLLPLYVNSDPSKGSDENGNGTLNAPFSSIRRTIAQIADLGGKGVIFIDGTFNEPLIPCDFVHIEKAENASKAEITTGTQKLSDGTFEFMNIDFINSDITISERCSFKIGLGTKFTGTSKITLNKNKVIELTEPLTSPFVANVTLESILSPSEVSIDGTQVLVPYNNNITLANEVNKFKLTGFTNNRYAIGSDGCIVVNTPIHLTLTNTKDGTNYTCKVKDKETVVATYTYTTPGNIEKDSSIYYFDFGKTYTVEVYEGASADTLIRSQDITIGNENNVTIDLNTYFVSASGNNTNGFTKATAFRTVKQAIEKVGAETSAIIMVVGTVNEPEKLIPAENQVINIKGIENATLNCSNDFIDIIRSTVTLENINVNGNVNLGNNAKKGTLILKSGTVFTNSNKKITMKNTSSSFTIEGSAKAGNILLSGAETKITVNENLTASNAGTITIENTAQASGRTVLTGSSVNSANVAKFKVLAAPYTLLDNGKLGAVPANKVADFLANYSDKEIVDLNVDLPNSQSDSDGKIATFSTLNSALKTSIPYVNLSFTISNGLETIYGDFLKGCTKVKTLVIPDTITELPNSGLEGTSIESIEIPASMKNTSCTFMIGSNVKTATLYGTTGISSAPNLETVTIKKNGNNDEMQVTFFNCPKLNTVIFEGITKIWTNDAFQDCPNLSKIDLSNITKISERAFVGCSLAECTITEPSLWTKSNSEGDYEMDKEVVGKSPAITTKAEFIARLKINDGFSYNRKPNP